MSFAYDQVAKNRKCFCWKENQCNFPHLLLLGFIAPKTLNYLTSNFEQKSIVCTIFDIYVYIIQKSQKMGQISFKLVH